MVSAKFDHFPPMISVTAKVARSNFHKLLDLVADSGMPIRIRGKNGCAVLVSESEWLQIQETLYLCSIPGMGRSIRKGMRVRLSDTFTSPGW